LIIFAFVNYKTDKTAWQGFNFELMEIGEAIGTVIPGSNCRALYFGKEPE
jgi:hypothetical protein